MTGLRYETTTYRSVLKPQWWHLILRGRLWNYRRRMWRKWDALPPDVRAASEVMRRRIDAQMFFGEDDEL